MFQPAQADEPTLTSPPSTAALSTPTGQRAPKAGTWSALNLPPHIRCRIVDGCIEASEVIPTGKVTPSGHAIGTGAFHCDVHGQFIAETYWLTYPELAEGGRWLTRTCPACDDQKRQEEAQRRAAEEAFRNNADTVALENVRKVGAPPYLRDVNFRQYRPGCDKSKAILTQCMEYAETFDPVKSRSVVMCGTTGTGKTMLAYCIAHAVAYRHGHIARVSKVYDMIGIIKQSWGKSELTEIEAYAMFKNPPLLIVDEVGVQFGSDTEKEIFFQIMNDRYEHLKPTIIISNLGASDLKAFVGDRVMDRLRANGGKLMVFDWQSHR